MADQQHDAGQGKKGQKEKRPQKPSLTPIPGQVTKDRKLPMAAFVQGPDTQGKDVQFYIGQDYRPAGRPVGIDPQGMAATLIDIPATATGMLYVSAKTEGMTSPVGVNVEIPAPDSKRVNEFKLQIEPTGVTHDENGFAHIPWTPRVFDAHDVCVATKIYLRGARPFKIKGLAGDAAQSNFEIDLDDKQTKTYEIVVQDEGLLEIDVFVEGVNINDQFRLYGAKKQAGPGPFERLFTKLAAPKKEVK